MGKALKKPPVYFTVAQARFNTLLKLTDYLPAIQDEMRKAGYPDFSSRKSIVLNISMQNGQGVPTPAQHESFSFGTVSKEHCFVLSPEALTLQSTNYGTFEAFSAMFLTGLELLHKEVSLDFTERVGLRYLDHVAPVAGGTLNQYLNPEVMGVGERLNGNLIHSFTETFSVFDDVRLISRVVIQDGGIGFPPDIQPEGMAIIPRFMEYKGVHALLDNDGFVEQREMFSTETVSKKLDGIHEVISAAFKATVKQHAFAVWDSE